MQWPPSAATSPRYSLAAGLVAHGFWCCGPAQINTGRPDAGPRDVNVKILPDGPILRISQDRAVLMTSPISTGPSPGTEPTRQECD